MFRARRKRFKGQSLNMMIPNLLTLMSLCAGLSAMRFALLAKWEWAVVAVILAGFLDNLDGRMARLLGGGSKFGTELDSLSDFVSFGVAPAVVLYHWSLWELGGKGWIIVTFYCICSALRLARFNSRQGEVLPPWAYNYFTGVSAPAGAGLALLPMMISFQFPELEAIRSVLVVGSLAVATAFLKISTIPTYSLKQIKIPQPYVLPTFLLVGIFAATLVTEFWPTFIGLVIAYFLSIPFSVRSFLHLRREAERIQSGMTAPRVVESPSESMESLAPDGENKDAS
jgi:CDP-diacylglycerol--serine O-phosphatidyltransferase